MTPLHGQYVERRGQLRETPELNESTASVDASVEMPKLHNIKLLYIIA